ncbi:B-cell scaffold protein with ankyrin repeats-like isoform X3 [Ostrea edulis]|nr:B-cell scaffold protein with ankyrin repeats-like isoform X3 [Ostrea edulis]
MSRTSKGLENDSMAILYADDGEEISSHLEQYLRERFRLKILAVNISSSSTLKENNLGLVILTPDMIDDIQRKPKAYLSSTCSLCQKRAFLIHDETVSISNRSTERILEDSCSDLKLWNTIHLGKSSEEFKMALIQIIELIDSTPDVPPVLLGYKINPKTISSVNEHIVVIFKKEILKGDVTVQLQRNNFRKQMTCVELNRLTYTFKPEGMPDGQITMEVFTNSVSAGKTKFTICSKTDNFSCMISDMMNPVEFFLQALNCDDTVSLDLELVDILTNGASEGNPLAGLETVDSRDGILKKQSTREFPTLLHVAAKLGLKQLCEALKKYPGYQAACSMKNKNDKTASQIALHQGHIDIAANIQPSENFLAFETGTNTLQGQSSDGYMTMNQFNSGIERQNRNPPALPERPSESDVVIRRPTIQRDSGLTRSGDNHQSNSSLEDQFSFDPR